jgi:hypothetical protein
VHQFAAQRAAIEPPGQMIRETHQHAFSHRSAVDPLLADIEPLVRGDLEKLLE